MRFAAAVSPFLLTYLIFSLRFDGCIREDPTSNPPAIFRAELDLIEEGIDMEHTHRSLFGMTQYSIQRAICLWKQMKARVHLEHPN